MTAKDFALKVNEDFQNKDIIKSAGNEKTFLGTFLIVFQIIVAAVQLYKTCNKDVESSYEDFKEWNLKHKIALTKLVNERVRPWRVLYKLALINSIDRIARKMDEKEFKEIFNSTERQL